MRNKIAFTKMVASGNDFVIVEIKSQKSKVKKLNNLAREICNRKYGVGADGLLILEKTKRADVRMRIFNPDGSEAQMCGNGVRCAALYSARNQIKIETKAGIIEAGVAKDKAEVRVKMTRPKNIKLDLPIKVSGRGLKVNFINTGVPHTVIFVEGIDRVNVVDIGRQVRFHKKFKPEGTNVDFVQIIDDNNIRLRTYERGVEDETLACGTGTVAAALISAIQLSRNFSGPGRALCRINPAPSCPEPALLWRRGGVNVLTKSAEVLKVEFNKLKGEFKDIWLEGQAKIVYEGIYNLCNNKEEFNV
ncbi:MAG: diaminopimelate epimerase [Candidatus Omnitrophota bacterium]